MKRKLRESPADPHAGDPRGNITASARLKGLREIADVKLHEGAEALDAAGLVAAAQDVDIIVADRVTEGRGEIFPQLPKLRAMVRCAVDIRNIDVAAASKAGVLVTRASPGFVPAVAELAIGFMVDLSRGVSRATADYQAGRKPEVEDGPAARRQPHRHHRLWQHRPLSGAARQGDGHGGDGRGSLCDDRRPCDQAG